MASRRYIGGRSYCSAPESLRECVTPGGARSAKRPVDRAGAFCPAGPLPDARARERT
jgi:hypothetical protein